MANCTTVHANESRCTGRRLRALLAAIVVALLCLCTAPSTAQFQVTRPVGLQQAVSRFAWMPYGSERFTGQAVRATVVWVPTDALCSTVDDAVELDSNATLPRPVTHFGAIDYLDVAGTVVLFNTSEACPLINQVFYVEAVLGATGAVVLHKHRNRYFPPPFDVMLTAPAPHLPAVALPEKEYETLRTAVVEQGVLVEVVLGWSTSEMYYG